MIRDPSESKASATPRPRENPRRFNLLGALLGIPVGRRAELPAALSAGTRKRWIVFMVFARAWNVAAKTLGQRTGRHADAAVESSVAHLAFEDLDTGLRPAADLPAPKSATDRSGVPRILFQTWKSRLRLPADFAAWSGTLRAAHPDWRYVRWDDADNRRFIECHHAWFLPTYDAYPREILRADAVRYFFLYQFGGLYADLDTECLRALDGSFDNASDVWLGRMGSSPEFAHSIPNAMMASRPRQEFWLLVISLMASATCEAGKEGAGVEAMTGPILLKQAHDLYASMASAAEARAAIREVASHYDTQSQPAPGPSNVKLLASADWYPIDWSNVIHTHFEMALKQCEPAQAAFFKRWLFPQSTLVTYWSHSWGQR